MSSGSNCRHLKRPKTGYGISVSVVGLVDGDTLKRSMQHLSELVFGCEWSTLVVLAATVGHWRSSCSTASNAKCPQIPATCQRTQIRKQADEALARLSPEQWIVVVLKEAESLQYSINHKDSRYYYSPR